MDKPPELEDWLIRLLTSQINNQQSTIINRRRHQLVKWGLVACDRFVKTHPPNTSGDRTNQ